MDATTCRALTRRVEQLKLKLGDTSETESISIKSQLQKLQNELNTIYEARPNLQRLTTLATEVELLNEPIESEDTQTAAITTDEKEQLLTIKRPQIQAAYNNLKRLASMDASQIIANILASLEQLPSLNDARNEVLSRRKKIEQVTMEFHRLVIENMLVLERFTALAIEHNEFWSDVEQRVKGINSRMSLKEQASRNKY